jgi:FAD/FMN-containing dehydrogenase
MPSRRKFIRAAGLLALSPLTPGWAQMHLTQPLAVLASALTGRLIVPGDPSYEALRHVASANARFDRSPVAIAQCASENDIARALDFAVTHDLELAVRCGGHDVLAASTCTGLVIDLVPLDGVEMIGSEVKVGGGVRSGMLNHRLSERRRMVPQGCNPRVGVSGLTLGGGLGWFTGTHGAACDHVASARVVTVDGRVVEASETEHQDLFWALRGGGGNFGIVSEWRFNSYALDDVVCGYIVYPGSRATDFLAMYRDFLATAPDSVTVEIVGLSHVVPVIVAVVCYSGAAAEADAVLAPLMAFGPPLASDIGVKPLSRIDEPSPAIAAYLRWEDIPKSEPRKPGSYWQGITLESLSDEAIAQLGDIIQHPPRGWSFGLGHVMRGAVTRVSDGATPMLRRAGQTTVHFDGGWSWASDAIPLMSWIDDSIAAMRPWSGTPYINYLSESDEQSIRRAYGAQYDRLSSIKQRYDPNNVLRLNRNVRPG